MVKVGLALGSGAARGWAHIGVIEQLQAWGIQIDVVSGCSIGALVGGAFANNKLEVLQSWACSIKRSHIRSFFDLNLADPGGPFKGERLLRQFKEMGLENFIEKMPLPFTAIATDLKLGEEFGMTQGSFLKALRASAALPGCLSPIRHEGRWLADGGIINPVPVQACRDMGADFVIAVNLNDNLIQSANWNKPLTQTSKISKAYCYSKPIIPNSFQNVFDELLDVDQIHQESRGPGYFEVLNSTLAIMQDQITRLRFKHHPPDITITPNLSNLGLFEFDQCAEAILEGMRAIKIKRSEIFTKLDKAQ